MNAGVLLCWVGVAAAGATIVVLPWERALRARHEAEEAAGALETVRTQAGELQRLRATALPVRRPAAGLQPRIAAVLTASGLAPTALASLAPEAEAAIPGQQGGGTLKRQRVAIVLAGPTLPQVGRFLASWRTAEPAWVVTTIDLTPQPAPPGSGDLPLHTVLGLESIFNDESPQPRAGVPVRSLLGDAR